MKHSSTLFLKVALICIGAGVLALCVLIFPRGLFAGEEATSDLAIWFDVLSFFLYLTALPFFYALTRAFQLLRLIDQGRAFSEYSLRALKRIKVCAVVISALYAAGMPLIYYLAEMDDAPGLLLIGLVILGASLTAGVFTAVLEKLLNSAMAFKTENDLTV